MPMETRHGRKPATAAENFGPQSLPSRYGLTCLAADGLRGECFRDVDSRMKRCDRPPGYVVCANGSFNGAAELRGMGGSDTLLSSVSNNRPWQARPTCGKKRRSIGLYFEQSLG